MPRVFNKNRETYPRGAIYIGRGSLWGNPFRVGVDGSRDEVIDRYEQEVLPGLDLGDLRGHDLVCFCAPQRCHGHSILREIERRYGENTNN